MWSSLHQISLIRYLFVCRVNRAMVRLPSCLSGELSLALGSTIIDRLPTARAKQWRKALAPWLAYPEGELLQDKLGRRNEMAEQKPLEPVPAAGWPLESVLFVYPGKAMVGPGELILWELKLMGPEADHGFFLEVILPALEELSSTPAAPWYQQNSLWGRFDIQAVYAARGSSWERVVSDSRLDLRYQATPSQWADGLDFGLNQMRPFTTLTWLTPFDLTTPPPPKLDEPPPPPPPIPKKIPPAEVPTLQMLLEALLARIAQLLPGRHTTPEEVWNILGTGEQLALVSALEEAGQIRLRNHRLKQGPKHWPGRWMGKQTFASIPFSVVPYLELASILHLGRQTHYGCGTFRLG